MSRRTRRSIAAIFPALLVMSLTACGEGDGAPEPAVRGLDSITVEGQVGEAPKVTFDGAVNVTKVESQVLTEGDGPEVVGGDELMVHLWFGNGFTQKVALDTYKDAAPERIVVDENLTGVFKDAIVGHTVGSRVAVAASAEDAFGEVGNPGLGIGNKDSVVMIFDLASTVLEEPQGTTKPDPSWIPKIVEKDDRPDSLDFAGAPQPADRLRIAPLIQGDGAKVEKGQTIVVDYLGQVYGGDKPFDSSFSRGEPAEFQIGLGKVVKGWDEALVGKAIGSRVLVSIPPDLGYGEEGNPSAGIKGTDTLYFVVDILAAA